MKEYKKPEIEYIDFYVEEVTMTDVEDSTYGSEDI